MLTFTSLGGTSLRVSGGEQDLVVFASAPTKGAVSLLVGPEENPVAGVLSWPGEYNEGGIPIKGIGHVDGQQVSYVAELDGVRAAFLSPPLQDWTDRQMEMVGDIDVLVLPVAEVKLVQKLVDEFDPRILILLRSKDGAEYEAVAKVVGAKPESLMSEYKLKGALPVEGREVVVLAS